MTVSVKGVTMSRDHDDIVRVVFSDGRRLIFIQHTEFMRTVSPAVQTVRMEVSVGRGRDKQERLLATFHSKHQYPVNTPSFGFAMMVAELTPAEFAEYWRLAHEHIEAASRQNKLVKARRVTHPGLKDLQEIEAGMWAKPAPPKPKPKPSAASGSGVFYLDDRGRRWRR